MRRRTIHAFAALAAAGLALSLLAGCQKSPEPAQSTIFAMDTVMSLTLYGEGQQTVLADAVEEIYALQDTLSVTDEGSEIYAINRDGFGELSDETAQLLNRGLELCEVTGGALDVTAYPAVKAWGFTTGEYRVPGEEELSGLADRIDYTRVKLDGNSAVLPQGVELDLGAVTKGYAGDKLAAQIKEAGITSALLDLGQSTITAVGSKPDGSRWRIGVQDPGGDGYLGVLELEDLSVGTSGGYQRYFEEGGVRYWHILAPDTAAPARSGLESVTVVSPSALLCDGLSTALFVMGMEDGVQFWREHPELNFEAVFVADSGELFLTEGLESCMTPAEGMEVTVLR